MKKLIIGLSLLVMAAILPVSAQQKPFFESLSKGTRLRLSEGYAAVAERFEALGYLRHAEGYHRMATELKAPWADEIPEQSTASDDPVREDIDGNSRHWVRSDADVLKAFDQYKEYFFAENLDGVLSMTTEPFYIPFNEQGMSGEEVRQMYETIFDQYPVNENDPETVFRSDSVSVTEMENGYMRVDVRTNDVYDDYFFSIPYWDSFQSYYFIQGSDGSWKLTAISGTESSF